MKKTPQQFKRTEVKRLITKILGDHTTKLEPMSICVKESLNDEYTTTDFSFQHTGLKSQVVTLDGQKGKGFVDGLFSGLHQYFVGEYSSLDKIRLADYNVNPIMSNSKKSMGTDAQASVLISVLVDSHGLAEFHHTSRSMIYSSFSAVLKAFQFYINCDRTFDKIQMIIRDAESRNRGDIVSQCMYNLSKLTEVNTYERAQS